MRTCKSHWKWLPTPLRWCQSILHLYICYCPVLTSGPAQSDLCLTFTGRRPVLTCLNTSTWAPVDVRLNMNLPHKKGTPKWVCRLGQLTRWGKQTFIAKVTVEDPNLPWQGYGTIRSKNQFLPGRFTQNHFFERDGSPRDGSRNL